MDILRQHGLYGGGLVIIDSPELVGRYNECLAGIGINPTTLKEFQIDGRGWSPEIATEKANPNYLSHGGAVQFAIILTPAQMGKPIYRPFYSFERALLIDLFTRLANAIARITKDAGVWVQIDPGLSTIEQLSDLTLFKSVTVTLSDTKGLVEAAVNQRSLVKRFVSEPDAWMDLTLRQQLIDSGNKYGDLRFAESFKPVFTFTEVGCYQTALFNGAFVFRTSSESKPIIVIAKKSGEEETSTGYKICDYEDRGLLTKLVNENLVEIPLGWYRDNPAVLELMRECLLVSTIYRDGKNETDFTQLNLAQREGYIMSHRKELPLEFQQLERLESRLGHGEEVEISRLPVKLRWLLARPRSGLSATATEVVWKLICQLAPVPVTTSFSYDKDAFFAAYGAWPEAQQRWAVNRLLSSGLHPRSHQ